MKGSVFKRIWLMMLSIASMCVHRGRPLGNEKWVDMKPEIFKQKPFEFKNKVLALKNM